MKLLHVTHQYPPAVGGAEKYIADLSEALVQRGHTVDVFTHRSVDDNWRTVLPHAETRAGVSVRRFRSIPRWWLSWKLMHFGFQNYWRTRRWYYEPLIYFGSGPVSIPLFDSLLREAHGYDLIHINQLHYSHSLLAYLAGRWRGLPIVITPHIHPEQPETYDIGYLQKILANSDVILTVTASEKTHLKRQNWNNEITVGGNALQLQNFPPLNQQECRQRFNLPADSFVMLFLGRKMAYKGLETCLQAFKALRERHQHVYFLAVGPETDFSEALWGEYGDMVGLIRRGQVSDEERLAAIAACDVLTLPSIGEAFGIVYLEAWAYQKAVIGANIAAVASLISHEKDGFLIKPHSTPQLIQHLNYFITHPEAIKKMGLAGREKLDRRYTIERIADTVEGVYTRLLRQYRNNPLQNRHQTRQKSPITH